jgi:hypothetical protein
VGKRTPCHYCTTDEVHNLLVEAGFVPIEVKELSDISAQIGLPPNNPDNNIVFIARAKL